MDPIHIAQFTLTRFSFMWSGQLSGINERTKEGGKEQRKKHLVERGIQIGPVLKERKDEGF